MISIDSMTMKMVVPLVIIYKGLTITILISSAMIILSHSIIIVIAHSLTMTDVCSSIIVDECLIVTGNVLRVRQ